MPHIPPVAELQELGQALYRRKDYNAAIEQFTIAIESHADPSASLLDNRAAAYEKLDDVQSALKDARTTIRLHEQDASGYLRAGKILQKMEKYQVALEIYKRGIRKKPKNVEVLHKMHDKLSRLLSPPASVDPFTQLPIEIVDEILSYLSFRHTVYVMLVGLAGTWLMSLAIVYVYRNSGRSSSSLFQTGGETSTCLAHPGLSRILLSVAASTGQEDS